MIGIVLGHLNQMNNNQNVNTANHNTTSTGSNTHHITSAANDDLRYHGTELVMLYDYKVIVQYGMFYFCTVYV